ncbi:unnamed protein product [marine sediment metagenome]|uniref:Uncharacterized protein n=1 Tax=marine sediment metagenome TaxID=412755 RepID=X1JVU7_9ZZZZ
MALTKVQALKKYFSTKEKPVTNTELIQLRRDDREGFDELAEAASRELGEELTT